VARQVAFDNCSPSVRCKADIGNVRKIRHEQLQRYLKNSSHTETQRLGQDLAGLHGSRQDADYDMEETLTVEDAQNSIDEAEAFLNSFSQLPPAQIGRAMEEYIDQTSSG
jgi:hypothetical protein